MMRHTPTRRSAARRRCSRQWKRNRHEADLRRADVGGTHARFALATIDGGKVVELGEPVTLKTAEHGSFQLAWQEFGRRSGRDLPNELSIAFAGPVGGEMLKLTNNPWVIRPALIKDRLGVDRYTIVNDFGAVPMRWRASRRRFQAFVWSRPAAAGATESSPSLGPGTGLGVAILHKQGGAYDVIETEGGHVDFAPLDSLEDKILQQLRKNFRRVSVERLVAGRVCGTSTKRSVRSRG